MRSTSQPQFCSKNTPATTEADQFLLILQHLASNSNTANFNQDNNRISQPPKSLTTTMPTFDGKTEKSELSKDLVQTSFKPHNHLTEEDKKSYFYSLRHCDAFHTFKNITKPSREKLREILTGFARKKSKLNEWAR